MPIWQSDATICNGVVLCVDGGNSISFKNIGLSGGESAEVLESAGFHFVYSWIGAPFNLQILGKIALCINFFGFLQV